MVADPDDDIYPTAKELKREIITFFAAIAALDVLRYVFSIYPVRKHNHSAGSRSDRLSDCCSTDWIFMCSAKMNCLNILVMTILPIVTCDLARNTALLSSVACGLLAITLVITAGYALHRFRMLHRHHIHDEIAESVMRFAEMNDILNTAATLLTIGLEVTWCIMKSSNW